jgi:hypothetical protein
MTGYIGPFYPNFTVFYVLDPRDIVVFYLSYKYDAMGLGLLVTSPILILHFFVKRE